MAFLHRAPCGAWEHAPVSALRAFLSPARHGGPACGGVQFGPLPSFRTVDAMTMDSGLLLDMYRRMVTIRTFDAGPSRSFTRATFPASSTPTSARRPSPWACAPLSAPPTA